MDEPCIHVVDLYGDHHHVYLGDQFNWLTWLNRTLPGRNTAALEDDTARNIEHREREVLS